jgi:hypothetical protein
VPVESSIDRQSVANLQAGRMQDDLSMSPSKASLAAPCVGLPREIRQCRVPIFAGSSLAGDDPVVRRGQRSKSSGTSQRTSHERRRTSSFCHAVAHQTTNFEASILEVGYNGWATRPGLSSNAERVGFFNASMETINRGIQVASSFST